MVSACAYMILLAIPSLLVRYVLNRNGRLGQSLNGWGGRLLGPWFVLLAVALAYVAPIHIEDTEGEGVIATPETVGQVVAEKVAEALGSGNTAASPEEGEKNPDATEKPHWEGPVPPGVRYVPAEGDASLEEALAELDELIGLGEVKAEVAKFAKFIRVAQQRRDAGLKVAPISYHMVFTGNPGTGKTTVARIMAKIYRALGVVSNGHLVETDRGGLIAQYVGQTAVKTGAVIDFALDGVLFIDEAYSITDGGEQRRNRPGN